MRSPFQCSIYSGDSRDLHLNATFCLHKTMVGFFKNVFFDIYKDRKNYRLGNLNKNLCYEYTENFI
jgi:hypothetical protein